MNNALASKELSFDLLKGMILVPVSTGFNLAIMGPPGVGKSTLCQELIKEASKSGLKCLYVITNNPVDLVKQQLRDMGVAPVARNEPVIFVDMYSWLLGEPSPERFQIDNASDVAALSVVISSAAQMAGDRSFVAFDTLSSVRHSLHSARLQLGRTLCPLHEVASRQDEETWEYRRIRHRNGHPQQLVLQRGQGIIRWRH